jgi:hypothetical protein
MMHQSPGFGRDLPDAPLAMPKQQLERRYSLFSALRAVLSALPRF